MTNRFSAVAWDKDYACVDRRRGVYAGRAGAHGTAEWHAHLLSCNGSGVAMMTYLSWQTARNIARAANQQCAFDTEEFPTNTLYSGNPWFLPAIGGWYRLRDGVDLRLVSLSSTRTATR
jgi:hypothetical protein